MKNKIYKIISLILSLGITFTNCEYAFAGKGDPLQEHEDYTSQIRRKFEWTENDKKNPSYPVRWEHEPNYWIWTDDYRTVIVYNIPYLMGYEDTEKENFVRATVDALIDSRKAANRAEELAKQCAVKTTEEFIKIFKKEYKKELTSDRNLISSMSKFLGESNEETVVNACLGAIGMYWACVAGHTASVFLICSGFLDALSTAHPIAGLTLSAALDLFCYFTGKSRFEMEKTKNYATLLYGVWSILQKNPKKVMDSNVLVTAVDKRNFYAAFRHNVFRRDDGAWCNFVKIGNLKCAPLARDFENGTLINTYLDIYKKIMTDEHLDLDKMQMFLNTGSLEVGKLLPDSTKFLIKGKDKDKDNVKK